MNHIDWFFQKLFFVRRLMNPQVQFSFLWRNFVLNYRFFSSLQHTIRKWRRVFGIVFLHFIVAVSETFQDDFFNRIVKFQFTTCFKFTFVNHIVKFQFLKRFKLFFCKSHCDVSVSNMFQNVFCQSHREVSVSKMIHKVSFPTSFLK